MLRRCYDVKHKSYKDYGAKGIIVCDRWQGENGLKNFIEDMGSRPEAYTLDRKNSEGNYQPDNCHWANSTIQAQNKLHKNRTGFYGVSQKGNRYQAIIKTKGKVKYLGLYRTAEEAGRAYLRAAAEKVSE